MKKLLILVLVLSTLVGCNSIPDKSIFEPLTAKELNSAMQQETIFGEWYDSFVEDIGREMDDLSPSEIAKYSDITYRRLFKYMRYECNLFDRSFINAVYDKCDQKFGKNTIDTENLSDEQLDLLNEQYFDCFDNLLDQERENHLQKFDLLIFEFTNKVSFEDLQTVYLDKFFELGGDWELYDEFNGDYNKLIEYVNNGGN